MQIHVYAKDYYRVVPHSLSTVIWSSDSTTMRIVLGAEDRRGIRPAHERSPACSPQHRPERSTHQSRFTRLREQLRRRIRTRTYRGVPHIRAASRELVLRLQPDDPMHLLNSRRTPQCTDDHHRHTTSRVHIDDRTHVRRIGIRAPHEPQPSVTADDPGRCTFDGWSLDNLPRADEPTRPPAPNLTLTSRQRAPHRTTSFLSVSSNALTFALGFADRREATLHVVHYIDADDMPIKTDSPYYGDRLHGTVDAHRDHVTDPGHLRRSLDLRLCPCRTGTVSRQNSRRILAFVIMVDAPRLVALSALVGCCTRRFKADGTPRPLLGPPHPELCHLGVLRPRRNTTALARSRCPRWRLRPYR